MSAIQEKFDDAFQVWGRSAPAMRADESAVSYVRRIARLAQKEGYLAYDEPAKKIEFDDIPDQYLGKYTPMLIDGIKRSVLRSDTVTDGTERSVFTRDENTGQAIRSFVRPDGECFVKEPAYGARPCRRVVRINRPATVALYEAQDSAAKSAMMGGW
jgi:hypothetical protein